MYTISRFLPGFGETPPGSNLAQQAAGNGGATQDDLLGLQRIMRNAQHPRRPVIGSWIMLPGASLARMIARMGYDFALIDCEHGDIDDAAMYASVGAVAAEGSHGLLVPSMSTVEEALAVVSYAKFPAVTKPEAGRASVSSSTVSGIRGVGSPFAPVAFRQPFADYVRTANQNTFIAVQIETLEGLENCEEIAKVDGIDMLFVGPNDLAASMGYPFHNHESIPEVQEAVQRILTAAKNAGKYAGMFCTEAKQVRARFQQGFDLMNLAGDVAALSDWNATQLAQLDDITGVGKRGQA